MATQKDDIERRLDMLFRDARLSRALVNRSVSFSRGVQMTVQLPAAPAALLANSNEVLLCLILQSAAGC